MLDTEILNSVIHRRSPVDAAAMWCRQYLLYVHVFGWCRLRYSTERKATALIRKLIDVSVAAVESHLWQLTAVRGNIMQRFDKGSTAAVAVRECRLIL